MSCITLCVVVHNTSFSSSILMVVSSQIFCSGLDPLCQLCIPLFYVGVFFKLVVMWPLLSLLPFFISLRSSVPAPQAFKNPKYFIFPLASNRFQTPPFPALSLFLLLIQWGGEKKPHTHKERVRQSERHKVSVLLGFFLRIPQSLLPFPFLFQQLCNSVFLF